MKELSKEMGMLESDRCQFCGEFGKKVEPFLCDKCKRKIFDWKGWVIENQPKNIKAEELARTFHKEYEKLASRFNYETRKETKGDWENLPNNNKQLMIAVAEAVMDKYFKGQIAKKRIRNE